ncbi:MAG: hypothetical protein KAY32_15470 [Candidatus Eisenbacteria sp.]|nr:hypothetical protein [Candidatus Eisenbacteria bacterium]
MSQKEWQQNKAEEVALDKTGHEFRELGPHMQLMCYMIAEEAYKDYFADQCDYAYERVRDQHLLG